MSQDTDVYQSQLQKTIKNYAISFFFMKKYSQNPGLGWYDL